MNTIFRTLLILGFIIGGKTFGQYDISGTVRVGDQPLPFANIYLPDVQKGAVADESGQYVLRDLAEGTYLISASYTGFATQTKTVELFSKEATVDFQLTEDTGLDEIVISGTLKPVLRKESPVPVEVYTPTFLKKNPTSNVFEALQNVNGVRPQLNCNICNTGDIHINGLEGPYTLVLIDGMPIVSGLSTVYGLSGIPNSLIERIEIVKGPASSLYGSEAVGGLINVITKLPEHAPALFLDTFVTGWGETNVDVGLSTKLEGATSLFGTNYFNYSNPIDANGDNFTDVTLQDRISVFNKWSFNRKYNRTATVAGRFYYEDRWGGELQWNPTFRGGDEVYGESIYTTRFEILGNYQLPISEKIDLMLSYTDHDQNSVYGDLPYLAQQRIGFTQLTWPKQFGNHDILIGTAGKYTFYDDNTPATVRDGTTDPEEVFIPSLFIQDEIRFNNQHTVLLGARYDYDSRHGSIFTPRLAYRWKISEDHILRLNAGTGFRVVNLFTEEHAALTGAREVIIEEELNPERSLNINLNYLTKFYFTNGTILGLEAATWYTHFSNAILPDYDTDANAIIYDNLNGYATSKGASLNLDANFSNQFKAIVGVTFQEVNQTENNTTIRQILTERYTATWALTYTNFEYDFMVDYTGNLYGPMRLPLLGPLDPRPEYSPAWSVQNIQITHTGWGPFEVYGGVKNILDWTPNQSTPFLIARANDPFDKEVTFNQQGEPVATPNNPYALTFDPSYVYAPNQGIRGFVGIRYTVD